MGACGGRSPSAVGISLTNHCEINVNEAFLKGRETRQGEARVVNKVRKTRGSVKHSLPCHFLREWFPVYRTQH